MMGPMRPLRSHTHRMDHGAPRRKLNNTCLATEQQHQGDKLVSVRMRVVKFNGIRLVEALYARTTPTNRLGNEG